jgi:hypothetical protein
MPDRSCASNFNTEPRHASGKATLLINCMLRVNPSLHRGGWPLSISIHLYP